MAAAIVISVCSYVVSAVLQQICCVVNRCAAHRLLHTQTGRPELYPAHRAIFIGASSPIKWQYHSLQPGTGSRLEAETDLQAETDSSRQGKQYNNVEA
jgi:hypothetical protein